MSKSVLRGSSTDSETSPDECIRVKHSNVIEVALLERGSLFAAASLAHVLLIKPESAMDNQI